MRQKAFKLLVMIGEISSAPGEHQAMLYNQFKAAKCCEIVLNNIANESLCVGLARCSHCRTRC